jgi:hypothetical protein
MQNTGGLTSERCYRFDSRFTNTQASGQTTSVGANGVIPAWARGPSAYLYAQALRLMHLATGVKITFAGLLNAADLPAAAAFQPFGRVYLGVRDLQPGEYGSLQTPNSEGSPLLDGTQGYQAFDAGPGTQINTTLLDAAVAQGTMARWDLSELKASPDGMMCSLLPRDPTDMSFQDVDFWLPGGGDVTSNNSLVGRNSAALAIEGAREIVLHIQGCAGCVFQVDIVSHWEGTPTASSSAMFSANPALLANEPADDGALAQAFSVAQAMSSKVGDFASSAARNAIAGAADAVGYEGWSASSAGARAGYAAGAAGATALGVLAGAALRRAPRLRY